MVGLVKLLAIAMIVLGVIYVLKPSVMKKVLQFWTKSKRPYFGGVYSLLFGFIFLLASRECASPLSLIIIGILALAKGIAIFVLGPKKVAAKLDEMIKKPVKTLRIFALVTIGIGVLIIYSL